MEAPSFPQVVLSPDQTRLILTTWKDINDDGDVEDVSSIQIYDFEENSLTQVTEYDPLGFALTGLSDGQKIVYAWGKEVYMIDLSGSSVEQLTPSFPLNVSRVLSSPDGDYVAIWVQTGQLFVLDMNTKNFRLIDEYNPFLNMVWSADSQWLAYMITASSTSSTLMLGNPDTLETIPLVQTGLTIPRWSPVSSQIALVQNVPGSSSLHVWDADTLTDRELIEWEGNGASLPVWSPDGSKIALSFTGEDFATIYVIDVNTGEVTELLHLENIEKRELWSFGAQRWSPDGEWLLYFDARIENGGLYVINTTSGDSSLLLEIPENTLFPDHFFWLPDSQ
ncbi:MAG: PD40 domain-containing protein [Anaerolineae bacterium]|nr:PD40 domain-containing protein [Anaerolineae bacterium]